MKKKVMLQTIDVEGLTFLELALVWCCLANPSIVTLLPSNRVKLKPSIGSRKVKAEKSTSFALFVRQSTCVGADDVRLPPSPLAGCGGIGAS